MYYKLDYKKMWEEAKKKIMDLVEVEATTEEIIRTLLEVEKQELEAVTKEHAERNGRKLEMK